MAKRVSNDRSIKISFEDANKSMPYAPEIEKSVLATMISDPQCINRVTEIITDERMFYSEANQKIYRVIRDFTAVNPAENLNLPIVLEKLNERNLIEEIGGVSYLLELSRMVESSENIEGMCKILVEKFMTREIITHCLNIASKGYSGSTDVFDLLNDAEAGLFKISELKFKKTYFDFSKLVQRTVDFIEKMKKSEVSGISTGYTILNNLTGGFQDSDLIIIAARPGVGKTALGLSLTYNISKYSKIPVGFFSLEMKAEQIVIRLISMESKIDVRKIRTGRFSKEEEPKITKAIRSLGNLKIFIDDTPAISLHELRAKARRMISENEVRIIFVDYLQLMQGPADAESREREISYISRGLKALAKELDIPIVALAQLNRQVEIRQTKRPMLSDLRESGAIEQDADIVCFLHRPDLYAKSSDSDKTDSPDEPKLVEFIIAKQRNGPTGSFDLLFFPQFTRFEEKTTDDFRQLVSEKTYISEDFDTYQEDFDQEESPSENAPF
ncbi:MAG: replicative DNA helicase [Ignavibacterium sp.]|jgi:replicative DNA helicase|nr:replicative DNA helicase [Ignavibacteria bacterium]MDH7527313.1 replicative DNA helicase [Ignavibacteria bacterium]NPV12010.1 replicative DNA helicase [Ignavibacteria bacterium]GIV45340.1 MAG: replicative DNA helicase [Ignavibacterium sp.]